MLGGYHLDRSFIFYLLPSFSLQAFSSAVEVLMLANEVLERQAYSWRIVSSDGESVISSSHLSVMADTAMTYERGETRKSSAATTVIVCGERNCPGPNKPLEAWLRECRNRRMDLVGIGSGTVVLARAGLAEGRRCSIHWEQFPAFSELFPRVRPTRCAFEHDGDLHTCSGGAASFDMFLSLVERDQGTSVANRICEKAIAGRARSAGDRQRSPRHSRVKVNHEAVIKIIEQMEANLADPLQIDTLAASAGLSRRQVERVFERELGRSPGRYYLELRLEHAHLLIASSRIPIVEIAIACGFVSASHFSKVYREAYGRAPHQTRLNVCVDKQHGPTDYFFPSPRPRRGLVGHEETIGDQQDWISGSVSV